MASKTTKYDLTEATDYLGFESLCHDLMSREGYKSIQPLGGTGDKGRDAIHFDKSTSISTVFAYSVRKDWEKKLEDDLKPVSRHKHKCDQFVFVSTSLIPARKFDEKKNLKFKTTVTNQEGTVILDGFALVKKFEKK